MSAAAKALEQELSKLHERSRWLQQRLAILRRCYVLNQLVKWRQVLLDLVDHLERCSRANQPGDGGVPPCLADQFVNAIAHEAKIDGDAGCNSLLELSQRPSYVCCRLKEVGKRLQRSVLALVRSLRRHFWRSSQALPANVRATPANAAPTGSS